MGVGCSLRTKRIACYEEEGANQSFCVGTGSFGSYSANSAGTAAPDSPSVKYTEGTIVTRNGQDIVRIEACVGHGSFGAVYRVVDVASGQLYAMKAIRHSLSQKELRRVERDLAAEAAICFSIGTHANVVSVRQVLPVLRQTVTNAKGLIILLDYAGYDLRTSMGTDFNGPVYQGDFRVVTKRLVSLCCQLYEGVAHMHKRGVLHQDLKPANLMLCDDMMCLRITDYGLAGCSRRSRTDPWTKRRTVNSEGHGTCLVATMRGGTALYMSPEMHLLQRLKITSSSSRRSPRSQPTITPATSDLYASALIVLVLFAQREAWKAGCCESARGELDSCVSRKLNVHLWTPSDVAEWAKPYRAISQLPFVSRGITGLHLLALTKSNVIDKIGGAADRVVVRARLFSAIRHDLQKFEMPADLVQNVLSTSLSKDIALRTSNVESILPIIRAIDPFSACASKPSPKQKPSDIAATMGGLTRLAAQDGRADDALHAAIEWLGACSRTNDRHIALAAMLKVIETHPSLQVLDLSRCLKQHWTLLCSLEWQRVWASVSFRGLRILDLCDQHQLCGPMTLLFDGIDGCKSLRELHMQRCFKISGAITPLLGECESLQVINFCGCRNLSGRIPFQLANCARLRELLLLDCRQLEGDVPVSFSTCADLCEIDLRGTGILANVDLPQTCQVFM
tara:strand:+ start:3974 stop:6010 length:2037 start_codon:yes stop_codon:yes gene_type:complete